MLTVEPTEVLTRDKKNLVVETFVLWKVSDPERFLEAVGTPETAETQLSDLVDNLTHEQEAIQAQHQHMA